MRKNKPLDESRKTGQTSGTKMAFYSCSRVSLNEREEKIWKEIIFCCVPEFH
ncbi:hypothetical protein Hanom_Chr16g01417981 [Helianthus anomalus]